MRKGYLSTYFAAVAAKRLSAVEADAARSNQHEYNGIAALRKVLGEATGDKKRFPTHFIWLGQENEAISSEGFVTWYDSRHKNPSRSEHRLYFPTTDVSQLAQAGDLMLFARRADDTVMIIIAAGGTTIENQLLWLFDLSSPDAGARFSISDMQDGQDREVDFTVRFILDELGIEVEEPEADQLDHLLKKYKGKFPTTREFSQYARQTLPGIAPSDEPDMTLMAWMNQEEKLFRRLERQVIDERLRSGFVVDAGVDVEGFLSFSLSVQQRRKSRAGLALENHLEEIFRARGLSYSREHQTENRSKPDFIFPGGKSYDDVNFPATLLTMLGVKTTCKDRWRQVLAEAARIKSKHLFTLEPGISENQTDQMQAHHLQLVLPASIHATYKTGQQACLMTLSDFVNLASGRQSQGVSKGFNLQ